MRLTAEVLTPCSDLRVNLNGSVIFESNDIEAFYLGAQDIMLLASRF